MNKTKLSPPWITYVHELEKMFEDDNDISIRYDDDEKTVYMFVKSKDKADALNRILKHKVEFGKTALKINIVEPNDDEMDILDAFITAFAGNDAFEYVMPVESPFGTQQFVVFKNKVVQFFNDQIDDINGNKTTLYQEMAKDIFKDDLAVHYCTMPKDQDLVKPLGEWP